MRTVITGGAGFIGSHLCERFLARGHEVICVDNLITGSRDNIEHLAPTRASRSSATTSRSRWKSTARWTTCCTSRRRPARSIICNFPIQTLKVGSLGTHNTLGLAKVEKRALPAGQHQRGLRRPGAPPAARGLLGQRQPHRHARLLRRGQALRRGDRHGLPSGARRQYADRSHLQHLRPAHAPRRRPRAAEFHGAGPARRSR